MGSIPIARSNKARIRPGFFLIRGKMLKISPGILDYQHTNMVRINLPPDGFDQTEVPNRVLDWCAYHSIEVQGWESGPTLFPNHNTHKILVDPNTFEFFMTFYVRDFPEEKQMLFKLTFG